jgi:hypothetical protein
MCDIAPQHKSPHVSSNGNVEEAIQFETGLENYDMTRMFSFTAAGFFAATALTLAASAQAPSVQIKAFALAPAVETAAAENPGKVYCYNGAKKDQANLYRGWTCIPERRPL